MRYKGLVVIILLVSAVLVGRLALAGGDGAAPPTVSGDPISVSCQYISGVTSVRVVALADVSSVSVVFGDSEYVLSDALPSGWAASRTISGKFVAGTVSYVYRGSVEQKPFVCN